MYVDLIFGFNQYFSSNDRFGDVTISDCLTSLLNRCLIVVNRGEGFDRKLIGLNF